MFEDTIIFILIATIAWIFLCVHIAKQKGKNTTNAFFAGLLFGIFALIYYLTAKSENESKASHKTKKSGSKMSKPLIISLSVIGIIILSLVVISWISSTTNSDVQILDSSEGTGLVSNNSQDTQTLNNEQTNQKVKSATLSIDRVQINSANLYPTRVTVTNTGDVIIYPKFDLYVYDNNNNEVCSGSPLINEFASISVGNKQTGELLVTGCMFEKDGSYTLKIDLMDEDYNKLDSKTEEFYVDFWSKLGL